MKRKDNKTDTEIGFKITSFYWSKNGREYILYVDDIKVLETKDFFEITKEMGKYLKLRFKE